MNIPPMTSNPDGDTANIDRVSFYRDMDIIESRWPELRRYRTGPSNYYMARLGALMALELKRLEGHR